ncbi:hypothetical protein BT96DRAFT_928261 [Gymnopus androsaceus JB14]|uniref:Uncharacterized protein n=1 Tax=Gymnopus androsaceus JB14 TaxID=1447944 RepID=A0A6A4GLY9_9AGAR|nr:hypothetical protein BT96DRAFT_928261 [Gymnopus androsaceus JB14]
MVNLSGEQSFRLRTNLDFVALRQRLRSEYGSSVQTEADIDGIVSDVEKDLEDCDAEIDRLQSRILVLQNQRRLLERYRTHSCSLRSPVRKIPNETVQQIFDYACGMNKLTSKKFRDMPTLTISNVCLRWRSLVKACPALWSRIHFKMESVPSHNFSVLDLYLESSQQSPLIIEITGKPEALQPHHAAVCDALVGHVNRWQQLSVQGFEVYKSLTWHPRHYPALQRLLCPHLDLYPAGLEDFKDAPQLCCLSVGFIPSVDLGEIQFPWKQLKLLAMGHHPSGMKNILDVCDKLTELQFQEVGIKPGSYELSLPPTMASVLETLSLSVSQTGLSESLAEVVFSSMACPSLTSLLLEARNNYQRPWPKKALCAFISRSSFNLTTLSIKFIPLSDADLIDLLHSLPSLLDLTIDDSRLFATTATKPSPITPRLIQSLHACPFDASSVLVQKLQHLHMTFSGSSFNDGDFIDMVSSRWLSDNLDNFLDSGVGTVCLRSAVMCFKNREVDENIYRRLRHVEKAGMRVVGIGKSS